MEGTCLRQAAAMSHACTSQSHPGWCHLPAAQQESSWWTVHCRCQMILSATETDKLFSVSVKWDGLLFILAPCDLICLKPSCFSLEWPRMSQQKEKNSQSQRSIQLFVRNAQGCEVTVGRHVTHTSSICQRVFSPADNPKYVAVSNQFGYERVLDRNQNNWFHLAQAPPFTGLFVTPPHSTLSHTHTHQLMRTSPGHYLEKWVGEFVCQAFGGTCVQCRHT